MTSVWQWTKCTSRTDLEGFICTPEATNQHCTCPAKDHKQSAGSWRLLRLIVALISTEIAGWLSILPPPNDEALTVAVKVGQLSTQFMTGLLVWQCVNSLAESSVWSYFSGEWIYSSLQERGGCNFTYTIVWVTTLFIILRWKRRCEIECAFLTALSVHIMTFIGLAPCILVGTKVKSFLLTPWKHVRELQLTLALEGGELSVLLPGSITPDG